jgi:predicted ATPase with chaperone activity
VDRWLDPRWQVCERPCISVGGELSAAMLELKRDDSTGVFIAPCQLKANNGVLIIDDFGRQVLSPRDLLNRWIVPLDRRMDYLTLASGMKFEAPFEVLVVFSSNLNPQNLADEAFMRRIRTKVLVDHTTAEDFDRIVERVVITNQVEAEPGAAKFLRERCLAAGAPRLRACYPKDIYLLVKSICEYEGRPVRLGLAEVDRAVALYFARTSLPE